MSVKLFIGNIAFTVTSEELRDAFTKYGEVLDAVVLKDRETNRSRGFGFVEMGSDEAGQKAIDEMNGTDLAGRKIVVNKARPREER